MFERPVKALIHAVDSIADTLDCTKKLAGLFLHALFGGEYFRAMEFMSGQIGPHICSFGSGFCGLLYGFRLCAVHPALNPPPDAGYGA